MVPGESICVKYLRTKGSNKKTEEHEKLLH